MGGHTLFQNLRPLHKFQGHGGVDRQCDLEVFRHPTQVVIQTSKVTRHIGIVQCGHLTQAQEGEHSAQCVESETPTYSGVCGRDRISKGSLTSKPSGCLCQEVKQNIQNGAKFHFHLRNGLLWYKQNRLYVPEGKIRDTILKKECHDGSLADHGGAKRTTTFLKKSYYWPNLKDSAEEYVKTCLTYQQNRTLNKKQAGLLQPLPIPEGPWESVSMDFIVSLPPSRGFDAIMVVVDRFNKMAHFIPP